MAIIAAFTGGINEVTVNGLYQWDYGQTLTIQAGDIPAVAEVHFANKLHETAIVRAATMNTDLTSMTVAIPDELLEDPYDITAYVYYCGTGCANTAKIIHLPINRRAKPSSVFDPVTPSEQTQFENMMTQINSVVETIDNAVDACTAEVNKIKDGTTVVPKANEATRAGYLNWYYNGDKVAGHHILAKRTLLNDAGTRLVLIAEGGNTDGSDKEYDRVSVSEADRATQATTAITANTAKKVSTTTKTMDAWNSDGIVAGLYAFIISNSSERQTIMLSVLDVNHSVESIGGSYNGNYNAYTVHYEPAITVGVGVPAMFSLVLNGSTPQGRCIEVRLRTAY